MYENQIDSINLKKKNKTCAKEIFYLKVAVTCSDGIKENLLKNSKPSIEK